MASAMSPQPTPATGERVSSSTRGSVGISKNLRDVELEAARRDIERVFKAVSECCDKVDAAVSGLGSALAAVVVLDRRVMSSWAMRDLRLGKRLMLVRLMNDVGTAVQKLSSTTRTIRSVSEIVRREVEEEMPPPERRSR